MKKILKEIVLCLAVAATSLILFVLLGSFYDSTKHNTLVNIIVWLSEGIASYCVWIFIPCFNKKKVWFFDGFALSSSYLIIVLFCLARQSSFNEYQYLDALVFLSSLIAVLELSLKFSRGIAFKAKEKTIPVSVNSKIETLQIWEQKPMRAVYLKLKETQAISTKQAALVTEIGENKTRIVLNDAVSAGILIAEGKTSNRLYKLFPEEE